MLTREMLRFDIRNHRIYPRFLDAQNRNWQEIARSLAAVYEAGEGYSREELAELTLPILNTARSPLVAKGLNKLLLDRCTFQETDAELEQFRMQVFLAAAQQFQPSGADGSGGHPDSTTLESFRLAVARTLEMEPDVLSARLYGDLPARQTLLEFSPAAPEALLHRYNLAQAQGLLWWAKELLIETDEPNVGLRRQFFRHLKFFRLLARIHRAPSGPYRIQLDGPLSLFENGRTYGLLLANFLPAVCALSRWQIQAQIEIPVRAGSPPQANTRSQGGPATLALDHASGLVSHLTQTSTYVPEEFVRFATLFTQEIRAWTLQEAPAVLEVEKQEWIVPDFSFRHASGLVVHLELFHRWHSGPLHRRLQTLQTPRPTRPLLAVGVDRALVKQAETGTLLQQSLWFQQHGFAFNTFPPVKRVAECLNGFLPENPVVP